MGITRRQFTGNAALGGMYLAGASMLHLEPVFARPSGTIPGATGERVAAASAHAYRPYRSKSAPAPDTTTWIQIDLGAAKSFDAVKLYPVSKPSSAGHGFPLRFRIEYSDDATFATRAMLADWSSSDFPNPYDQVVQFTAPQAKGRYVRLTATRLSGGPHNPLIGGLSAQQMAELPPEARAFLEGAPGETFLSLSRVEVLSKGGNLALGRPVSVDETLGNPDDAYQLIRPARPQGEGVITDNPGNVTAASTWKPVAYRAEAPRGGIELADGLFKSALQNNARYLLDSFTTEELLRHFRLRAGKPAGNSKAHGDVMAWFWEDILAGSNAGRFLMGAGNTLRWIDDAQLRERMNAVVDGIAECRRADGYIMAYPEDTIFLSERGAYTRSWVTQGLMEAGYAGNAKAFELLRGYYDWYNKSSYLPQVLRRCCFGPQGTVANARMYFTPVGKPKDLQVVQRYMQENYWLDDLIDRKPEAIWQYPYDRPHSYIVTFLEPYLDLYRATGDGRYFDAARAGWELFQENWQNTGGALTIIEGADCPPKSNSLYRRLGETCGNVFWILLNQRFHLLSPEEETYVAEIEKSIYNVILANQVGSEGIRYHTMLVGRKAGPHRSNTCCEGQGTRLLGSLPEFIYSVADDGVYVNLFEASTLDWTRAGRAMRLQMHTRFPEDPQVRITVSAPKSVQAKIRVRVPSWATGKMDITVNGQAAATGTPGTYVTLDRSWSAGDTISFDLPIGFRMTRYAGIDQIQGSERYALEYGPLLMAALNGADTEVLLFGASKPQDLLDKLAPVEGKPLRFKAKLPFAAYFGEHSWLPYFKVGAESFSCFPVVKMRML